MRLHPLTNFRNLLNFLLSGEDSDTVVSQIHDYLRNLATQMREQSIPVNKYTIFTQLGKDPKDYPNSGSMPAVQVGLKLLARGKHVKAKDVMSFVVCGNSEGKSENAAKNAYPMDEVLNPESGLLPDIDHYLHKQILPPVERLCAPISGTNVTLLAECLGLDTSKYRVQSSNNATSSDREIHPLESQIPSHIRFKDCEALSLVCLRCKHRFQYRGLSPQSEDEPLLPTAKVSNTGLSCPRPECGAPLSTLSLTSQLECALRAHTSRYYAAWLTCDEATCGNRTRQMSVYGHRCLGPKGLAHGCSGKMRFEYSEKGLYNQLLFLQGLFDTDKSVEGLVGKGGEESEKLRIVAEMNRERWEVCRGVVRAYLDRSGWGWVSMEGVFGFALKGLV